MPELITRCPNCSVAFRVLPAHLSAAQGLARCGTCLLVFNARDNLLDNLANSRRATAGSNANRSPEQIPPLNELPVKASAEFDLDDDEVFARALRGELRTAPAASEKPMLPATEAKPESARETENRKINRKAELELAPAESVVQPPILTALIDENLKAVSDTSKRQLPLLKIGAWFTAAVFLAAAALAVYVYLNSRTLSRDARYRDYVAEFCALTKCPLGEYRDLDKIAVHQFLVRADLEQKQKIRIDVLIENQARYDQRFPGIRVVFTDIENRTVKEKTFWPADYLVGELRGATKLPAGQQIHLTLQMADPGAEATNYRGELTD